MNHPDFTPPSGPNTQSNWNDGSAGTGAPQFLAGSTEESVTTTSTVQKSGRTGRVAVGGLVAALAIGGAFGVTQALNGPTGPANSDEAVEQFFAALDADDWVGVAEVMHPSERESIAQPMFRMVEHARRLEVMAAPATPGAMDFADITVDGMTYSVETTGERLHYVTTTGGTISAPSDVAFPAGPLFERFDIEMPEVSPGIESADLAAEPMKFAVVEDEGSWYVSLWYSAAEDVRRTEGAAFPGVGTGPTPVGAATPDAVMEDMVRAMADLDATGVLTLLDPNEAAALYDYNSLYMDELQGALDEIRAEADDEGASWKVDSVDFAASEVNGRQVVNFESMAASFTVEEEGESKTGSFSVDDNCMVAEFDGESFDSCEGETTEAEAATEAELKRLLTEAGEALELSDTTLAAFEKLANVETGITVVERDGRWYLSAMPTMIEAINDHMAVLEPTDLVAWGTDIEEIIEDQDRLMEELPELLMSADTEALFGSEDLGLLEGFFGGGEATFVEVADSIDGDFGVDDPAMSVSTEVSDSLAAVLVDNDGFFPVDANGAYLSWLTGTRLDADSFVSGAYVYGEGVYEILEFDAPVDLEIMDPAEWTMTEVDGVIFARRAIADADASIIGDSFAFLGNYVIWTDGQPASHAMRDAQIEALK